MPAPSISRARKLGHVLLRGVVALIATAALAEFSCRFLLHSQVCASWGIAKRLRDPARFGNYKSDDAYWEMKARLTPPDHLIRDPGWDPRLGWTSGPVHASDLCHDDEPLLAGRRPILFFGDSYAFGVPDLTVGSFARWTEQSDLARDWCMLNYGCGGHGLDQIFLVLQGAVERHLERRPVVIASLLVDDDIDRCILSVRDWPKPRLVVRDGSLSPAVERVPSLDEYLATRSALSGSRCLDLLHGAIQRKRFHQETPEQAERKRELGRAILTEMAAFLHARDVPFFFVLFLRDGLTDPSLTGWREPLVISALDEAQAPWVSVRPAFRAHAELTGRAIEEYFVSDAELGHGHYNLLGNHVAFQVVREGLREHLGIGSGGDLGAPLEAQLDPAALAPGAQPPWFGSSSPLVAQAGLDAPYVVFDPLGERAEGHWALNGDAGELHARAALLLSPSSAEGAVRVCIELDGEPRSSLTVRAGEPPQELELDLRGAQRLTVRTAPEGAAGTLARLVLDRFRVVAASDQPRIQVATR
jgi:hypothetical protein